MDSILLIIEDYIFDLTDPKRNWPDYYFNKVSFSRWTGYELIRIVKRSQSKDEAIKNIEKFSEKMLEFSMKDFNDKNDSLIFKTAYEVTTDILDIIRCTK